MKTQVVGRILTGEETKTPQQHRSTSKRGTSFGAPTPSPLFSLTSYTPWSVQATYSSGKSFKKLPSRSAIQKRNPSGPARPTLSKNCPNNPWRVISAPSCYTYNHAEGSFTNGRGCTWTPHYFRFCQSQQTFERASKNELLEFKPSRRNISQSQDYLKPTKSWIWNDQPPPQESKKRETFTHLMKSPYLREHTDSSMSSYSYQNLQYSQKCQAWLKSHL